MSTKAGRAVGVCLGVLGLAVIVWAAKDMFGASEGAVESNERWFVCAETGKPFRYELKEGDSIPVYSPPSGKRTGYPAELCYWTKEGTVKDTPTPVLLNETIGKSGPTYCPECGRLVVGHNPRPQPGSRPPPMKDQQRGPVQLQSAVRDR